MSGVIGHFAWAKSKRDFDAFQRLGWTVAPQRATHHSSHGVLMQWAGANDPAWPDHLRKDEAA